MGEALGGYSERSVLTMHIAHAIDNLSSSGGGTSAFVADLGNFQSKSGLGAISLILANTSKDEIAVVPGVQRDAPDEGSIRKYLKYKERISSNVQKRKIDVLHVHGLWSAGSHFSIAAAKKNQIPVLYSPHGMAEPWAINYKKWKKRLAWVAYQKRDLEVSKCLHATCVAEANQFRRLGLKRPIAIIPNAVHLPPLKSLKSTDDDKRKTILFLSRIQKKKGLINLVRAWSIVRTSKWKIRIIGPEEEGHLAEIKELARELRIINDFEFEGPVYGDLKWERLRSADLFVLPTYSENFGIVVAESLASKLPVITTKGAPWQELETFGCGWWVDIGVEPLAKALEIAIALTDEQREEMGVRGRRLIEENYTWPKISVQMKSVYEWILGRKPKPDCVVED